MKSTFNQLMKISGVIIAMVISTISLQSLAVETSIFSKNQKFDKEGVELYRSNLEMKDFKKVGFGVSTGGMTGLIGFNFEVNLDRQNAFIAGLGTGEGYNSFNFSFKQNYESLYLSPYLKAGYSNWFNTSSSSHSYENSDVLNRVLTRSQKESGKFNKHLLAAAAGLEYNQLEGEMAGLNFYGELLIMTDLEKSVYLPTAGLGLTYFY